MDNNVEEKTNKQEGALMISHDLTTLDSVRRITSLDLDNQEDKVQLLNALQNVDIKLNDIPDTIINCTGFYIEERPREEINEESGEVIKKHKYITFLFDDEGKSYLSGSFSCFQSFKLILSIIGRPTKENPIKLKVVKVPMGDNGHKALKLFYVE